MSTNVPSFHGHRILKGLFYGQLIGFLYFISTLIVFWPDEELYLIPKILSKIHVFLFSFSFWAIVFSLLLAAIFFVTGFIERNKSGFISDFFSLSVVLFIILTGYGVYFHYDYKTSPHYPFYLLKEEIIKVVLFVFLVAILGGLFTSLLLSLKRKGLKSERIAYFSVPKIYKLSVVSFSLLLFYFLAASLVSNITETKGRGPSNPVIENAYILGLDGASWNILVPLLKAGALPNIAGILENSALGHLDTYGEQFTPPVWTSIATGKVREKHGINDFQDSMYHWRAKPIWEIIGDRGDKVGVVNWMNAFPAVDINGFMIANNQEDSPSIFTAKHPEDFDPPLDSLFAPAEKTPGNTPLENMMIKLKKELRDSKQILEHCRHLHTYRAIFTYIYTIDAIQHFFWEGFNAGRESLSMSSTEPNVDEKQAFLAGWTEIDGLIGDIIQKLDKDTVFFILSDHGSRPINQTEMVVNIEKILDILGFPPFEETDSDEPRLSILNEELIQVSREMGNREFSRMVEALRNIMFWPSKKPIFKEVRIGDNKNRRFISLLLSRPLKVRPKNPQNIKIGKDIHSYDDIVDSHPWSGRHRARGMLVVCGPYVKKKFLGAWTVDSPYFFLFRLLHGRINGLDRIYPFLKFFRLADPITTLDITPTLLNMCGYPLALDMDGRDFTDHIAAESLGRDIAPIKSYGLSEYFDESKILDEKMSKKIKDEMRALGYIK